MVANPGEHRLRIHDALRPAPCDGDGALSAHRTERLRCALPRPTSYCVGSCIPRRAYAAQPEPHAQSSQARGVPAVRGARSPKCPWFEAAASFARVTKVQSRGHSRRPRFAQTGPRRWWKSAYRQTKGSPYRGRCTPLHGADPADHLMFARLGLSLVVVYRVSLLPSPVRAPERHGEDSLDLLRS